MPGAGRLIADWAGHLAGSPRRRCHGGRPHPDARHQQAGQDARQALQAVLVPALDAVEGGFVGVACIQAAGSAQVSAPTTPRPSPACRLTWGRVAVWVGHVQALARLVHHGAHPEVLGRRGAGGRCRGGRGSIVRRQPARQLAPPAASVAVRCAWAGSAWIGRAVLGSSKAGKLPHVLQDRRHQHQQQPAVGCLESERRGCHGVVLRVHNAGRRRKTG